MLKRILSVMLMLCLAAAPATAEKVVSLEELKAQFILNYVPYLSWPKGALNEDNKVVICFIEGDSTASYLRDVAKKKGLSNIKVIVKERLSSFNDCNILYVSKAHSNEMDRYIEIAKGKRMFTLSDAEGFVENGGVSSFIISDSDDVQLNLNITSLKESNIEINADFLGIMKIIK